MKEGFWGLATPTGTGRPRAHIFGPPAPFFRHVLEASRYVELYDEMLGYEPWRRGVATDVLPPSVLSRRLEGPQGAFFCLVGYPEVPVPFARGVPRIFFSPHAEGPQGLRPGKGDMVIGLAEKKTAGAAGGVRPVTARQVLRGVSSSLRAGDGDGAVIIIDSLVMEPSLTGLGKEVAGKLTWYPLVDTLAGCFASGPVAAAHLLPRPLPRRDAYPAFVLARLVSRLVALALGDTARG